MNAFKNLLRIKYLPEALIFFAAFLLCSRFLQYLPTTPDDYATLFTGFKGIWLSHNRLNVFFTEPIYLFTNRLLFSIRWTAGAHVATFLAPTLVLYLILRRQSLLMEARLGACFVLAVQVLGYEHTTPLGYPIVYSIANAISIWSGFQLGALLARKDSKLRPRIEAGCYILLGCMAGQFYEYFPLLFFCASLWGFLANRDRFRLRITGVKSYLLRLDTVLVLASLSAPILLTLFLKVLGWLIGHSYPNFNSYEGTSIDISSLSIQYLINTAKISIKTLLNSTIITNRATLLSWPEKKYHVQFDFVTCIFSALLTVAVLATLVQGKRRNNELFRKQLILNKSFALASLTVMTASQLVLHSLTTKQHQWFFDIFRTYLNASMAVTTASFAFIIAFSIILETIKLSNMLSSQQLLQRSSFLVGSALIGYLSYLTMFHNVSIAEMINTRAKLLEDVTTTCLRKQQSAGSPLLFNIFESDPLQMEKPFIIHSQYLEPGSGGYLNTICRDAIKHPSLFKSWSTSRMTRDQMDDLVKYGYIQPRG